MRKTPTELIKISKCWRPGTMYTTALLARLGTALKLTQLGADVTAMRPPPRHYHHSSVSDLIITEHWLIIHPLSIN